VAVALCYSYYTGNHIGECKLHEFFISFNLILCIIVSVTSVLPAVQEHQPNSGLLQVLLSGYRKLQITGQPTSHAMGKRSNKECRLLWMGVHVKM
jgi:hypothetical protein